MATCGRLGSWPSWLLGMGAALDVGPRRRRRRRPARRHERSARRRARSGCASPARRATRARSAPAATSVAADGTTSTSGAGHSSGCAQVSTASTCTRPSRRSRATTPTSRSSRPSGQPRWPRRRSFSQVCNVWAPMYRQATAAALNSGAGFEPSVIATAYDSLLSAWKDYLAHDNDGRPDRLHRALPGCRHADQAAAGPGRPVRRRLRKRMVSAIILGGNVQVPAGRGRGWQLPQHPDVPVRRRRPGA